MHLLHVRNHDEFDEIMCDNDFVEVKKYSSFFLYQNHIQFGSIFEGQN